MLLNWAELHLYFVLYERVPVWERCVSHVAGGDICNRRSPDPLVNMSIDGRSVQSSLLGNFSRHIQSGKQCVDVKKYIAIAEDLLAAQASSKWALCDIRLLIRSLRTALEAPFAHAT